MWDQKQAQAARNAAHPQGSAPSAVVLEASSSRSRQLRPLPLNTVALLQKASTELGMGPADTLHIAEQLYLKVPLGGGTLHTHVLRAMYIHRASPAIQEQKPPDTRSSRTSQVPHSPLGHMWGPTFVMPPTCFITINVDLLKQSRKEKFCFFQNFI